MINEEIRARQQFVRTHNELNKGVNVDTYIEGNKQRVEQNRKLYELSVNSGMDYSGNIIRQNVLNSSASSVTSLNNVVDTEIYREDKKNNNNSVSLNNQGRNIVNNNLGQMNSLNSNIGINNFNNKKF